ncbi:MAG TPA: peptidyl-prolyl cis-trans isomerase [Thermoanaerobaculia bacterium]|nr:peptidyl-prolyl cis-trans isomerase [Thermoanaerobaculia bacterium]
MLKAMRSSFKQLKWILVFIIFLFVLLVFVDWGAGGLGGGGGDEMAGFAARVNGETISLGAYERALFYTEKSYEQIYGQNLTPEMRQMMNLPAQVVASLIDQTLLLQQARKMNLEATPQEVRERILRIEALSPGGRFVGRDLYERYVTLNLGFRSAADFEDEVAREVTLTKLDSAMESSIVISPKSVEDEYRRRNENATIHYIYLPADRLLAQASATPAEVADFYKANASKYAHGEQKRVKYLLADVGRIRSQLKIDEPALRAAYESNRDKYRMGESVRVRHILVRPESDGDEADAAARKEAEDLVAKLEGGADFAQLAGQHSDDPGSAANGGDLGYFERGRMVPEFEQVAFTLPPGQTSDVVKSQFGYHIIRVVDKREGGSRPFEEVRFQLEQQLRDERSKDQAREEITRVRARLDKAKVKSDETLRSHATEQVSYNDSGWLSSKDPIPGIGRNASLDAWIATAKAGELGPVTDSGRGPIVPWIAETRVGGTPPLAEIRAEVEADAKMAKAREAARQALADAIQSAGVDAAATRLGITATEATVSHDSPLQGVSGNVGPIVDAALAGEVGQTVGPLTVDQGAVAFRIDSVNKFDPQAFDAEKSSLLTMLRQTELRKLRASMLAKLRNESDIVTNETLLRQSEVTS